MTRKLLWALVIIGAVVLVLIFNNGKVSVDLVFAEVSALKSLVFLAFVGVGLAIGLLLK